VTTTSCLLGCSGPVCARITPSNLPADVCDTPGTATLAETGVNNVDTGARCDLVVPQSGGAPEICVRKYENVLSFGLMHVTGPRALAIVATTSMTVDGYLDAAAHFELPGPGASDPLGAAAGEAAGGGFSTAGAATAGTSTGGGPTYGTVDAIPLRAGAKGAAAGIRSGSRGLGGAGGGALHLVACGTLTFPDVGTSAILVTGGSGRGGAGAISHAGEGGGGGGSGGTILIEAAKVVLAPRSGNNAPPGMVAGGGGGGGGGGYSQDGADGDYASGGTGAPLAGTGGGGGTGPAYPPVAGGTGATLPTPPGFLTGNGGSGGAAGRIRINTVSASPSDFTSFTIAPPPTFGALKTH
jgi:hypothetical protein